MGLPPWGSFDGWTREIRDPLVSCALADPGDIGFDLLDGPRGVLGERNDVPYVPSIDKRGQAEDCGYTHPFALSASFFPLGP